MAYTDDNETGPVPPDDSGNLSGGGGNPPSATPTTPSVITPNTIVKQVCAYVEGQQVNLVQPSLLSMSLRITGSPVQLTQDQADAIKLATLITGDMTGYNTFVCSCTKTVMTETASFDLTSTMVDSSSLKITTYLFNFDSTTNQLMILSSNKFTFTSGAGSIGTAPAPVNLRLTIYYPRSS